MYKEILINETDFEEKNHWYRIKHKFHGEKTRQTEFYQNMIHFHSVGVYQNLHVNR